MITLINAFSQSIQQESKQVQELQCIIEQKYQALRKFADCTWYIGRTILLA
eukprot:m.180899 g.180899  ORF g.180899 m.180899 type:complete len:51 (+) comp14659_c0_seq1:558-710(+)